MPLPPPELCQFQVGRKSSVYAKAVTIGGVSVVLRGELMAVEIDGNPDPSSFSDPPLLPLLHEHKQNVMARKILKIIMKSPPYDIFGYWSRAIRIFYLNVCLQYVIYLLAAKVRRGSISNPKLELIVWQFFLC